VLGFEADIDWADITGSGITTPTIAGIPIGATLDVTTKIEAIATARARAGVALNNWLIYATGGAAFIKETASGTAIAGVPCGTAGVLPGCAESHWRPGLAVGGGAEWGFVSNWTAKAEYLYIASAAPAPASIMCISFAQASTISSGDFDFVAVTDRHRPGDGSPTLS
jgi:outer membrane immunogenic protein